MQKSRGMLEYSESVLASRLAGTKTEAAFVEYSKARMMDATDMWSLASAILADADAGAFAKPEAKTPALFKAATSPGASQPAVKTEPVTEPNPEPIASAKSFAQVVREMNGEKLTPAKAGWAKAAEQANAALGPAAVAVI